MTNLAEYTPAQDLDLEPGKRRRLGRPSINRPVSGATHDKALPTGRHPLQLYSLGTPNGVKVTVMLEELLALGHAGAEVRCVAHVLIGDEEIRSVAASSVLITTPRSRLCWIVAISKPVRVFEIGLPILDGSAASPLKKRFRAFLPAETAVRAECLSWLLWQMGSAPYLGGGFGHFYAYAPTKIGYAIDRFAMEVKRQLDVLDKRLADNEYLSGRDYTIADMAVFPWYGGLVKSNWSYDAAGIPASAGLYKHVQRWADTILERPAVRRGRMVQSCSWRAVKPAARASRRQRF